jgi:hypothetical protein
MRFDPAFIGIFWIGMWMVILALRYIIVIDRRVRFDGVLWNERETGMNGNDVVATVVV